MLVLLAHQLAGEALVRLTRIPVPGPVAGLALLALTLALRGRAPSTERAADGLLRHLALLFVPAGTGVVEYAALLREQAVPIAVALVVSTVCPLLATAAVLRLLGGRP